MMTKHNLLFSMAYLGWMMALLGAPFSTVKAQNESPALSDSLAIRDTLVQVSDTLAQVDTLDVDESEKPIKKNIFDALYCEQSRPVRLEADLHHLRCCQLISVLNFFEKNVIGSLPKELYLLTSGCW